MTEEGVSEDGKQGEADVLPPSKLFQHTSEVEFGFIKMLVYTIAFKH